MSAGLTTVVAVAACGTVVTVTEAAAIPLLRRAAIVDVPGHRSSHAVPTPRGGGIAVAAGLLVAAGLIGERLRRSSPSPWPRSACWGRLRISAGWPPVRLIMQAVGGVIISVLLVSGLAEPMAVLVALVALGAIWITGFVNVFNFMDGVNGISGAHALIAGTVYAWLGRRLHDGFLVSAGAAVAVGALAFLPWNAGRARVFLGDAGSYALGAALATLAAHAALQGVPVEAAAGPLVLYVADTSWTLQRRVRAGERWFEPHRTHVYQRWCDVGWSHQRVTLTAAAVTVMLSLLGAVSLTGQLVPRAAADLAVACVVLGYLRSPALLARRYPRGATVT